MRIVVLQLAKNALKRPEFNVKLQKISEAMPQARFFGRSYRNSLQTPPQIPPLYETPEFVPDFRAGT